MQAIILAAGMGNRLGRYTADNTKCMLSINGKTLIERALDALAAAGVQTCVIVVGYKKENLMAFLGDHYKTISIHYVINDVYHKTNNIYSLYLAKDHLAADDSLLLESDVIFEEHLIAEIAQDKRPVVAAVAPYEPWMDGTVTRIDDDDAIIAFIPKKLFNFDEKDSYYKTVNIYKFSRAFSQKTYIPFLEAYIRSMGENEYYEQVLRVIAALDQNELKAFVLQGHKWYEIDDAQDKAIAESLFAESPSARLSHIQGAYGGYWRFPQLLDFCYLVNPYFPPERMQNELKACFTELLTQYPSGLTAQNLLAAKLFNVDESHILTGNGAAELIQALAPAVTGTVGVIKPTFNEYAERLRTHKIVAFTPERFVYTKDDVLYFATMCDTLIFINPDNPSGNYICKNDIIAIVEYFHAHNKTLILDESFIDFCDDAAGGAAASLLADDILKKYPSLIIIKSLSKSYGIPGIRLGVLVCGDGVLIRRVRENLPVWNINSFAEYFLQIIGKYQKEYVHSCQRLIEERRRFKAALEQTGLMTVFPSQANYFLCELTHGRTARAMAEQLLAEQNIFIKDLTGKVGVPGDTFIRVAIRNKADNNRLLSAIRGGGGGGPRPPPTPRKAS
jgi:histidinol-phosphate/aromatic aminotransferase/cobyric acid decarboxylase-like protein/choline kinase